MWELVVAHLDLPDLIVLGESVVVEDGEDQRLVEGLAVGDLDFQKQLLKKILLGKYEVSYPLEREGLVEERV